MRQKALTLAEKCHEHHHRRNGRDHIDHVKRVGRAIASKTHDEELISAGYLHDSIECANPDEREKLRGKIAEISPKVLEYVESMTQKDGEDYLTYAKRITESDELTFIKRIEIRDNYFDDPTLEQKFRYAKAIQILGKNKNDQLHKYL